MPNGYAAITFFLLLSGSLVAQEQHLHPVPERLGKVSFPTTCSPAAQAQFERAVALLHSFAYFEAETAFRKVGENDPHCALAHWGMAMSHFHQLWDPSIATSSSFSLGSAEIERAQEIGARTDRERGFISALAVIYANDDTASYPKRIQGYLQAMQKLAAANPADVETQVFYALALLAAASPSDKTHANQKRAVEVLEPLYERYPQHPGLAHYLIHACDNSDMAREGLPAALAYAKIAPSAPHALHMPSHIFTRLGMWDDSIASNSAAKAAAARQGDMGEQLHAMDYLVYAYLQNGNESAAAGVLQELKSMPDLKPTDAKIAYAATAMPIRYAVERKQWADAAAIAPPPPSAPPQVIATAVWARGLGLARKGDPNNARTQAAILQDLEQKLRTAGRDYWAGQVEVQRLEVLAWSIQAEGNSEDAVTTLKQAADMEDAVEKLPVTPGPIVPAREQLGDLLLQLNRPQMALKEFQVSLQNAPGRRGATMGVARATQLAHGAEQLSQGQSASPQQ